VKRLLRAGNNEVAIYVELAEDMSASSEACFHSVTRPTPTRLTS
jgi:hypothetical protein